jgi:hypothetical protein
MSAWTITSRVPLADRRRTSAKEGRRSLIDDERPLTERVHLAFPAGDNATVRAFHAAALAAGYEG